jgi:UDP-glucose-4-epimerase GalE
MHKTGDVRKVLVTGGAGYIGSHTAKALARAGFEPVVLDNLSNGHAWAVRWGPFVQGDLADRSLLADIFQSHQIGAVVHLAAHADVGESMSQPRKYFQNNVIHTLHLLDAMLDAGVRRLVFSSSCAVYGVPQTLPITEEHARKPISPYGESKLFVEKVLRWYRLAYSLQSVALRYFNAAGADAEGELGEVHVPETHILPLAIETALGQRPDFTIYGNDYPTADGTAIRDYIHVTDIADAHVRALEYLRSGGASVALNLGTGAGSSVREVVAAVESVSGRRVNVRVSARRAGDPGELVAGCARAHAALGWQPCNSGLRTIVETAWRWHVSRAGATHDSLGTLGK